MPFMIKSRKLITRGGFIVSKSWVKVTKNLGNGRKLISYYSASNYFIITLISFLFSLFVVLPLKLMLYIALWVFEIMLNIAIWLLKLPFVLLKMLFKR